MDLRQKAKKIHLNIDYQADKLTKPKTIVTLNTFLCYYK